MELIGRAPSDPSIGVSELGSEGAAMEKESTNECWRVLPAPVSKVERT